MAGEWSPDHRAPRTMDASNSNPDKGQDSDGGEFQLKCIECSTVWDLELRNPEVVDPSITSECPGCGRRRPAKEHRVWWLREERRASMSTAVEVPASTVEAAEELAALVGHGTDDVDEWVSDLIDLEIEYVVGGEA